MANVQHFKTVTCVSPRAAIWERVADTERLNRFIGNAPLDARKVSDPNSAVRFVLRSRVGPVITDYEEEPYEWAEGRRLSFRRVIKRGLLAVLENEYTLRDADHGGTLVDLRMTLTPRYFWAWPAVWLVSRGISNSLVRFVEACDTAAAEGALVSVASAPSTAPPSRSRSPRSRAVTMTR